jgi:excisionase family DNA binding protein
MNQTLNTKRIYSPRAAAEATDLSERTIWRLIADGKIKAVRLSARRRGIPSEEIERIASNGVPA